MLVLLRVLVPCAVCLWGAACGWVGSVGSLRWCLQRIDLAAACAETRALVLSRLQCCWVWGKLGVDKDGSLCVGAWGEERGWFSGSARFFRKLGLGVAATATDTQALFVALALAREAGRKHAKRRRA